MRVFFSYSHKDEAVRNELDVHFSMLRRNGEIETWHDRRILGGEKFDEQIRFELEHADIILLLVSPYFLNSDYCYSIEMSRSLERANEGTAHVLPVIAEVCDWHSSPIGKLKALPLDGKPLSKFANVHDGFLEVVKELRAIIRSKSKGAEAAKPERTHKGASALEPPIARSSNLQIRKEFTGAERDRFLFETFEYMMRFFEGSLEELQRRNPEIETIFRKVTANVFTCQIYRNGKSVNQCQISVDSAFSRNNSILYSREFRPGTCSDLLSVEDDGQVMYLKPMHGAWRGQAEPGLSKEGASEHFWSALIQPLQGHGY